MNPIQTAYINALLADASYVEGVDTGTGKLEGNWGQMKILTIRNPSCFCVRPLVGISHRTARSLT
jgi:hypothetical protein